MSGKISMKNISIYPNPVKKWNWGVIIETDKTINHLIFLTREQWKYTESLTYLKKIAYLYQTPNFKASFLWSFKKIHSILSEVHRDGPNGTGNAKIQNTFPSFHRTQSS